MSKFKVTKSFNYPVEDVFRGFLKITKREFPKFNEKNPIGIKHSRIVKDDGSVKLAMVMEVTKFEKNSVYETTSKIHNDSYISRYTFVKVNEETTKIVLEEEQYAKNFVSKIALVFQGLSGKSKTKEKINRMASGVTEEIEIVRTRQEKNAKKL